MSDPVTVVCSSACTVTHVVTISGMTDLNADQVADLMSLWGLFLVTGVVILCGKAIYNRFRIDTRDI